jgi:hypothetical protein
VRQQRRLADVEVGTGWDRLRREAGPANNRGEVKNPGIAVRFQKKRYGERVEKNTTW